MTQRFVLHYMPLLRNAQRNLADRILLAVATIATICSLIQVLNPESFTIRALKTAGGDPPPSRVLFWEDLDRAALSAAAEQPNQNFVADLVDNRAPSRVGRDIAALFFARGTYALWPRRMYITFPSVVVVGGDQLATAPLPRDAQWMAEHHAGSIVQFRLNNFKPAGGTLLNPSDAER